jgi:hypothetical protein
VSWTAYLTDDRGHDEGQWNYTHNCNGMANAIVPADELRAGALRWWGRRGRADVVERIEADPDWRGSWWDCLDEMEGPAGAAFLDRIIKGLEADPERFRAMNPENGWGDYDSFLKTLAEMRNAVPEWPTTWAVSG